MNQPPAHSPHTAPVLAILVAILRALLASLMGRPAVRRRGALLAGVAAEGLRAEAIAEDALAPEEWVEWVLVPANWRNGFWWVPPFTGARAHPWAGAATARHGLAAESRTRAPPGPLACPSPA